MSVVFIVFNVKERKKKTKTCCLRIQVIKLTRLLYIIMVLLGFV